MPSAAAARAAEDDDDDRELHGLDPDVEDEERDEQLPRERLVDPEGPGEPEPLDEPEGEDDGQAGPPGASSEKCPCSPTTISSARDRRRQSRHRYQPATAAIDRAMSGSTTIAGGLTTPRAARMNVIECAIVNADAVRRPRAGDATRR